MTYIFTILLTSLVGHANAGDPATRAQSCVDDLAPRGGFTELPASLQELVDHQWRKTAGVSNNPLFRWAQVALDSWVLENELDLDGFVARHRMSGLDLDGVDVEGRTALMHSVIYGKHKLKWALLRHGARVDLRDDKGRTAADYEQAIYDRTGRSITPELRYIEKYLTIDGKYVGDEVWAATRAGDLAALENLLKRGLFVDFFDLNLGASLLTIAASRGDLPQMRLLLKYGANPRFRMRNGDGPVYPLPRAAAHCQKEAVGLLLAHGASINDGMDTMFELNPVLHAIYEHNNGRTPALDHLGMLEFLLANGADPDANYAESTIRNKLTAAQMIKERHGGKPESEAQIIALFRKYNR